MLRRHANDCHNGVIPDYVMNVTGVYHGDAMLRQITEAIKIRREGSINSKTEWNTITLPQAAIVKYSNWWIVILSHLARAWEWEYAFACLNVSTYCNSFSQTEKVWRNETCLKAKIKASAWKTIRKTWYSSYENHFQVFQGFSEKNYPEYIKSVVSFSGSNQ